MIGRHSQIFENIYEDNSKIIENKSRVNDLLVTSIYKVAPWWRNNDKISTTFSKDMILNSKQQ